MERQTNPPRPVSHAALDAWQQLAGFPPRPSRIASLRASACGLSLDLSGQQLDTATLDKLLELADQCDLAGRLRALFEGEPVNASEGRPALHSRLRDLDAAGVPRDADVAIQLHQLGELTQRWANGQLLGFSGSPLRQLVNIGIGGSDLGPRLVCGALAPEQGTRFVANMDPEDFHTKCEHLDPAQTLFTVCSKSFTTAETRVNTEQARLWLRDAGCPEADLGAHFIAITANPERARAAGFADDRILQFRDWVGGRYSLWSTVGISIALTLGMEGFRALLRGAQAMDVHVADTPLRDNLAALLGLVDVWNFSFRGCHSLAILPYAERLALLPAHLQQLMMESTGKRVGSEGQPLDYSTGVVVWGAAGTTGQHSFHQLLHQGNQEVACEFVLPLAANPSPRWVRAARQSPERHAADRNSHRELVAHCLAQMQALRHGDSDEALAQRLRQSGHDDAAVARLLPQMSVPGQRLFSLLTLPRLDAFHLGALLALYEHRVYCASVLWGINAFDQWGVELGKRISGELVGFLDEDGANPGDAPAELAEVIAAYHQANRAAPRTVPDDG